MNINCIICSDLFVPTSAIYVTRCGHIFHYTCLTQWIERSKTCPQCRNKTSEKTIFRIYFNIVTSEGIEDDAVTLQSKLDAVKLQLRLKENQVKTTEEVIKTVTDENVNLEEKNKQLKVEMDKYRSGLMSVKEQLSFYKDRAKSVEKAEAELQELRKQIQRKEQSMKALTGSMEEATEIINHSACPKTLSIIATTLKKELQLMEKKKNNFFTAMKRAENELHSCRKELNILKLERDKLKNDLLLHKECEEQMQILRQKISNVIDSHKIVDPTLSRIANESPAPLLSKSKSKGISLQSTSSAADSPTVADRIKEIKESNSPYLKIKSSSVGLFLNTKEIGSKYGSSNFSIFKKNSSTSLTDITTTKKSLPDYHYDGFGGHSKEERYPEPKLSAGIKRSKSSTMSSSKFRKLAKPATKKIDEFLDITKLD